jgi:uncharacterized protein with HEPN domain
MSREEKKLLFDIQASLKAIESYMQGVSNYAEYQSNPMLQDAVERNLEIIGEAVNRLMRINPSMQISNARRMVDTRNFIIHSYDIIDNTRVWTIIINHLPILKAEVENLLKV